MYTIDRRIVKRNFSPLSTVLSDVRTISLKFYELEENKNPVKIIAHGEALETNDAFNLQGDGTR